MCDFDVGSADVAVDVVFIRLPPSREAATLLLAGVREAAEPPTDRAAPPAPPLARPLPLAPPPLLPVP